MRGERGPDTSRDHCEPNPDGQYQPGSDGLPAEPQPSTDLQTQPESHASPDAAEANRRLV
jgi:hypothetical protein